MSDDTRRILLVEDEILIALDTSDVLTAAGYEVIGPATSLQAALALAEREPLHGAVLDVYLAGKYVWPAAEKLAERRVPFVLLTGFGAGLDVPVEFTAAPRLGKPIDGPGLIRALGAVSAPGNAGGPG